MKRSTIKVMVFFWWFYVAVSGGDGFKEYGPFPNAKGCRIIQVWFLDIGQMPSPCFERLDTR